MKTFEINGLMLDMARVTERFDHYMSVARSASAWGYNTIFAHATDNEGCAIAFQSRPELASPHALTRDQIGTWLSTAKDNGLMIVPEIECFGHTRFIHDLPQYRHLAMPTSGDFNAIDPLHPDTHAILKDLLHETAEVFDSPYIHAGFDEVNLGNRSLLGEKFAGMDDWEVFADMVNLVYGIIRSLGKQMMIWGDHLVSEPKIAERIPKDIIVCDWQYHDDLNAKSTEALLGMGFRVICCPSSSRSGDMIMPRANTQGNLQRFSRIAHQAGDQVLGLMNTVWCPGRMLCGTELFAMALGGAWFNDPESDALSIVSRFVNERYGLGESAAKAILRLSTSIPRNDLLRRIMQTETSEKAPPAPITQAEALIMNEVAGVCTGLRPIFEKHTSMIRSNREEFANYLLACDIIDWINRLGIYQQSGHSAGTRSHLIDEGSGLLDRCRQDWGRRRYDDDPKRDNDTFNEMDGLITNLGKAVAGLQDLGVSGSD